MTDQIHSCSYYCHIPACIKAQRDELRDKFVALPDTHRGVSVELLRKIEKFADEAQSHYSGMNDEVCQSYSEQWQQALIIMGLVGAIIDNKGEI